MKADFSGGGSVASLPALSVRGRPGGVRDTALHAIQAVWPWTSHSVSLGLGVCICNRMVMLSLSFSGQKMLK